MKSPIAVKGIDGKETKIEYNKAKNISVWIIKNKFVIPKILYMLSKHAW